MKRETKKIVPKSVRNGIVSYLIDVLLTSKSCQKIIQVSYVVLGFVSYHVELEEMFVDGKFLFAKIVKTVIDDLQKFKTLI